MNDIQRLYSLVSTLVNLKQQGMEMSEFLRRISSLKTEFNSLLPVDKTAVEDLARRDKFFMVVTLAAISPDLAPVWIRFLLVLLCHLLMMCLLFNSSFLSYHCNMSS